jgi:4-hydroxybenzoate polyprenyltransferase
MRAPALWSRCRHWAHVLWLFAANDMYTVHIPMSILTVILVGRQPEGAAAGVGARWLLALWYLCTAILPYFSLYILAFAIQNQLVGLDEDQPNKPFRPLVRGLVSPSVARVWGWVVHPVFWGFAAYQRVLGFAVAWSVLVVWHNFGGGDSHWLYKNNVFISLGVMVEVGAVWTMVFPAGLEWQWIVVLGLWCGTLAQVQDKRDVAGDRMMGRQTWAILYGERG